MRRAAFLFAGIALVASAAFSGEANVRRSARHIPGRYIVVLESSADATAVASSVRNFKGSQIRHTYKQRGFKGLAVELSDSDAQALTQDVRVQFVEEDSIVSAATAAWGLDRIDQRSLPLSGDYVTEASGAGVKVYVVDTGIFAEHNDFGGRVVGGFNAFADDNGTADCNGHGTHVAGIIGGSNYGVAKSATLVPVRVLDCTGTGSISTVLAGLDWVLNDHEQTPGPAVVNMSLGGDASSAMDAAVNNLLTAGLTTVVAAGNNNQNACATSPARVVGAITVGASTETDQRADFSNFGVCVDVFAPGTHIVSDWYTSPTAAVVSSGTSVAAPFVTGVAALCLQQFPNATPAAVSRTIMAQATPDVLGAVGNGSPNRLLYSLIGSLSDTGGDSQLLGDPSFDYGSTFWALDICSVINPTGCGPTFDMMSQPTYPSRSGKHHASLGGPQKSFKLTSESVTIPSTVRRAELSVYLWIVSKNKRQFADDVLKIEIRDNAGKLLETLGTYSNLDGSSTYLQRRFDLSRYRGKSIRISFTGVQNPGPPTWFLLDDVTVNVWH